MGKEGEGVWEEIASPSESESGGLISYHGKQ